MAFVFDPGYYLSQNTDVATAVALKQFSSAYDHYVQFGAKEMRNPNALFNAKEYAELNPDVSLAVGTGAVPSVWDHYVMFGLAEGRVPSKALVGFDANAYLAMHSDVDGAVKAGAFKSAIEHYLTHGHAEGRSWGKEKAELTNGTDKLTANQFNAGLVYTPGGNDRINSLQDEDQLTGIGTNPTLTATLGNANDNGGTIITPKLTGVETVNVAFTGSGTQRVQTLDLQDSEGLTNAVNITRITDEQAHVHIRNMASVPAELSVSNTHSPADTISFTFLTAATAGAADVTKLTLSNAQTGTLNVQAANGATGIETIDLVSTGSAANNAGILNAKDLVTLNITGAQDLTIRSINDGNTNGKFTTIDGSTATGKLNLTLDGDLNTDMRATNGTGKAVDFTLKTGTGDDTLSITATGLIGNAADTINLGAGTDTAAFSTGISTTWTNGAKVAGASAGIAGVENIVVNRTANSALADTTLTLDLTRFTADEGASQSIVLTNKGDAGDGIATFDLRNASAAQATAVTVKHSTDTNNHVDDTVVEVSLQDGSGTNDTVALTIADGLNSEARFNVTLTATAAVPAGKNPAAHVVENITITDSDTEANSVRLTNASQHTGTLTLKGGQEGQFLNLDVAGNGYGIVITGAAGDATTTLAAAARDTAVSSVLNTRAVGVADLIVAKSIDSTAYTGDVTVRVGTANQDIKLGAGNDTVIFADQTKITQPTAGLTIDDTVAGGAGTDTIVLDGAGTQILGNSEWTHLSGIDQIRIAGQAGSNVTLRVTDHLIDQTDAGNRITIINNDGDLTTNSEQAATVEILGVSASNAVTFVGANGNGLVGGRAAQRVVLDDTSANGTNHLNGGDSYAGDFSALLPVTATDLDKALAYSVVTGEITPAAAAATLGATVDAVTFTGLLARFDGNNNVLEFRNNAEVTLGDLANTSNFSKLELTNTAATHQKITLTLDNATVDRLVDNSHTASALSSEVLTLVAKDNINTAGTLVSATGLTLHAADLTAQSGVQLIAGRGENDIKLGTGADTVVLLGNFARGDYGDTVFGQVIINELANNVGGVRVVTDKIVLGAGANNFVETFGTLDVSGAQITGRMDQKVLSHSGLVVAASQLAPGGIFQHGIEFVGAAGHQLVIIDDIAGDGNIIDLSKITVSGGTLNYHVITSTGNGTFNLKDAPVVPVGNVGGWAAPDTTLTKTNLNPGTAELGQTLTASAAAFNTLTGVNVTDGKKVGDGNDTINSTVAFVANSTIDGAGGTDTLVLTDGSAALATTLAGRLANIEIVRLNDGFANEGLTIGDTAVTVRNEANKVATVVLGNNAAQKFVGNDNVDTVTLGVAGQSVDTGKGNDVITATVVQLVGSSIAGGEGTDVLNLSGGGTGTLVGVTSGIDTVNVTEATAATVLTLVDGVTSIATIDNGAETQAITLNLTGAQLSALTATAFGNTGASQSLTLTDTANANLSVSGLNLANLTNLNFNAGGNAVTMTAAQVGTAALSVTGAAGSDTLTVTTALTAGGLDRVTNIETIVLNGADNSVTTVDGLVAANATLTVNATAATGNTTWNGAAETNGKFNISTGAGNDSVTGGRQADTISGGAGNDTINGGLEADRLTGGDGSDIFVYTSSAESTGATADTITDFNFSQDKLLIKQTLSGTNSWDATAGASGTHGYNHFDATANTIAFRDAAGLATIKLEATPTLGSGSLSGSAAVAYEITGANGSANTITTGAGADMITAGVGGTSTAAVTQVKFTGAATIGQTMSITINGRTFTVTNTDQDPDPVDTLPQTTTQLLAELHAAINNANIGVTATSGIILGEANAAKLTLTGSADGGPLTLSDLSSLGGAATIDVDPGSNTAPIAARDIITGGVGVDTFVYTNIAESVFANRDVITDFAIGGARDKFDFLALDAVVSGGLGGIQGAVTAAADANAGGNNLIAALNAAANANATDNGVVWFEFNNNTYIYKETVAGGTTYVATDLVIELTGTGHSLVGTDFVWGPIV